MVTTAPEAFPSPRGAHLEMMAAVLAGEGLGRVAEIAARHAGSPVAVVVPRIGVPLEEWAPYERYVAARLAGGRPTPPSEMTAEVPICSSACELASKPIWPAAVAGGTTSRCQITSLPTTPTPSAPASRLCMESELLRSTCL